MKGTTTDIPESVLAHFDQAFDDERYDDLMKRLKVCELALEQVVRQIESNEMPDEYEAVCIHRSIEATRHDLEDLEERRRKRRG